MYFLFFLLFNKEALLFNTNVSKFLNRRFEQKRINSKMNNLVHLMMLSDDPKEIESFFINNVGNLTMESVKKLSDRIEYLKAKMVVAQDGGVWRVEDITPRKRINLPETYKEVYEIQDLKENNGKKK